LPGAALDPFERLIDAFLDEQPPNTARGYRTDLAQWATWLTRPGAAVHPYIGHRGPAA